MEKKTREKRIEKERIEFKKLIAINPNYFGNIEGSSFKPIKKIIGNTTYEEVTCIGFNPALNLLEATVQIKLPGGYSGILCTPGSNEYVRFYIDYGNGAGWVDAGVVSFNSHDIPDMLDCAKKKDKPLSYVVTLSLDPYQKNCKNPVLPKVRAILSWQVIPPNDQPNWSPVWGNVLDEYIQIKSRDFIFADVFEHLSVESLKKLPELISEVKPLPIPIPDPPPYSIAQLADLYSKTSRQKSLSVEPHRFGYKHINTILEQGNQDTILSAISEWQSVNLNWTSAVELLEKTKADVSYEELECLGLEYNLERLIATFRIKKPVGYSGNLCSKGSLEYIAFWADWNNTCKWTYLNTVTVNVHDIAQIPSEGIVYSAILPVDLNSIRQSCEEGAKIGRIRAVLSWNVPPSTVDPDNLKHWGNRLDTHVQIRAGNPIAGDKPVISIIGGIGIDDINVSGNGMTISTAIFAFGGGPADPWLLGRACPFGGLIIIQGPPILGYKYRLRTRKYNNPMSEQIVTNTFHIVNWLGIGSNITPDPGTGFVSYLNTLANMNQVLSHWVPSGDGLNEIRLELATMAEVVVGWTPWYSIQVDNKSPRRRPILPPYEPPLVTCEIHIDSGGDCKDFIKGTKIKGHFVARDEHFGAFSLVTLPSSMSPPNPTTSTSSTSQTATFSTGGDEWELDTSTMKPCGYVVLLRIWDRAIINSIPKQHNHNSYDVGFCLRK